jgi:hypothetical protein
MRFDIFQTLWDVMEDYYLVIYDKIGFIQIALLLC